MVETVRMQRLLLVCGLLASMLFVVTDVLAGMLWKLGFLVDNKLTPKRYMHRMHIKGKTKEGARALKL